MKYKYTPPLPTITTYPNVGTKLCHEGALPDFTQLSDLHQFYHPFYNVLFQGLKDAKQLHIDLVFVGEVHSFIIKVSTRILQEYPQHKAYLKDQVKGANIIWGRIIKRRSDEEHQQLQNKDSHWFHLYEEISRDLHEQDLEEAMSNKSTNYTHATMPTPKCAHTSNDDRNDPFFVSTSRIGSTPSDESPPEDNSPTNDQTNAKDDSNNDHKNDHPTHEAPPTSSGAGGGDDGDSSDSSSDSNSTHSSSSLRRSSKKKAKKKRKNDIASLQQELSRLSARAMDYDSDSDDEDKEYRKIIKSLGKSAKNYKMKELTMHPEPKIRRERFNTWITDLKNILSTNHKTRDVLKGYPAELNTIDNPNVDKSIKVFLASVTTGMAKKIVNKAPSAYQGLIDLRRNYGQTNSTDVHREKKAMMSMKQDYNELATMFLRRIRLQLEVCDSVGCEDFDEVVNNEALINIVLEGLNDKDKRYSTTIATLKDRYRISPESLSLIYLEELFFDIDDKNSTTPLNRNFHSMRRYNNNNRYRQYQSQRKTERANYSQSSTNKPPRHNHRSNHNNKSNGKRKLDMWKITCYICNEPGHFANQCPN